MRQGTRSSRKRRGGRRGAKAPTVARLAEQKLIESRVHPLWCEEYGPDGEIVRVAEWAPMPRPKPMILRISCTDYAPKKTDWRERGVVPPGGIHPWDEEAARLRWGDRLGPDVEDTMLTLARFAGGGAAQLACSWAYSGGLEIRFELVGSLGTAIADLGRGLARVEAHDDFLQGADAMGPIVDEFAHGWSLRREANPLPHEVYQGEEGRDSLLFRGWKIRRG